MLELGAGSQIVDAEHIDAHGNEIAPGLRQALAIGLGHAAQGALLRGVDGGFGWGHVAGCARFHLEDDQRIAVPGHKIEIAALPWGVPAPGHDGIPPRREMKVGQIFAAFAGEQMLWALLWARGAAIGTRP